jgi:hypothetical protein
MPEIVNALGAAEKARAENHVSATIEERFEKFAVVAGIVFEVGVLNENNVAGDFGETAAECGAFALILRLKKDAEIAQLDGIGAIDGGGEGFAGALQLNVFRDLRVPVEQSSTMTISLQFGQRRGEGFRQWFFFVVN